MTIEIKGKNALVTGANRGIGKAIVEAFLAHGADKVYIAVRDLENTTELVTKYGDKVVPAQVDLSQPESVKALAALAQDVDIVVNNAGVLVPADTLSDNAEEAFTTELEVNVFGLIRMANAFAPVLEARENSAFVQLNSVASIKTFTGITTYSASKAASYSITQGLKEQFSEKGIAVVSVHPGPIATDMTASIGMDEGAEPVATVAEAIIAGLKAGDFHVFPDPVAKEFWGAYQSYATNIIEAPVEGS